MRQPKSVPKLRANQEGAGAGAPQAPSRVLKRAVSYLERVKRTFAERPEVYRAFLSVMHAFKDQRIDIASLVAQVYQLFEGHPHLLVGFNTFLPLGHATAKPTSLSLAPDPRANAAGPSEEVSPPHMLPAVAVTSGW